MRIEYDYFAECLRFSSGVNDRFNWYFQLQHHNVRLLKLIFVGSISAGSTKKFAPGTTTMLLSPSATYMDAMPVATLNMLHAGDIDAVILQGGQLLSERVTAKRSNHSGVRTEPGGRDRLIAPFAAGNKLNPLPSKVSPTCG